MDFRKGSIYCLAGLAWVGVLAAQTPVTFLEGYNGGSGSASAMVIADFNNDGILDVAAADIYNGLTIFLGNGNGTFKELPTLAVFGGSIATADFNGDGNLDLVVGGYILLGNGDGTFQNPMEYSTTASFVVINDFNGDGIPDLAVASSSGEASVQIFYGDGTGGFAAGQITTLGSFLVGAMITADFNNDGRPDIAVALTTSVSGGSGYVDALFGAEYPGEFSISQIAMNTTNSYPSALAIADFNGDGFLDLAVADRTANQISILLGNSTGFHPATHVSLPPAPDSLAIADLNGDGVPDLVAGSSTGEAAVYFGKGNGAFSYQREVVTGYQSSQVALANLTGNSTLYLISANFTDIPNLQSIQLPALTIMRSNGPGKFVTSEAYPAGAAPTGMTVADFNGDGNPDMAAVGGTSVHVFLGNGKGRLQPPVTYTLSTGVAGIASADVTGDGKSDLVTTGSSAVQILPGNGDGTFGTAISSPCPMCTSLLVVADINHDGKPDVITTNNYAIAVLLGNGDGTFQSAKLYPMQKASSLVAGDFNGDGNLDLVVTMGVVQRSGGGVYILYGASNGSFGAPVLVNYKGSGAIVADFNNDGYLDIAMGFNGGVAIYLGNGNGSFRAPMVQGVDVFPPLLAADFNGDGFLDLIGANHTVPGAATILLGHGDGTFSQQTQPFLAATGYPVQFADGDFRAGGKPDLLSIDYGGNSVWLLTNTTP